MYSLNKSDTVCNLAFLPLLHVKSNRFCLFFAVNSPREITADKFSSGGQTVFAAGLWHGHQEHSNRGGEVNPNPSACWNNAAAAWTMSSQSAPDTWCCTQQILCPGLLRRPTYLEWFSRYSNAVCCVIYIKKNEFKSVHKLHLSLQQLENY